MDRRGEQPEIEASSRGIAYWRTAAFELHGDEMNAPEPAPETSIYPCRFTKVPDGSTLKISATRRKNVTYHLEVITRGKRPWVRTHPKIIAGVWRKLHKADVSYRVKLDSVFTGKATVTVTLEVIDPTGKHVPGSPCQHKIEGVKGSVARVDAEIYMALLL